MADGERFNDIPATRREVDFIERGLQRQIDDQRRANENAHRDVKEEMRRMGEGFQKGMSEIALQVSRLNAAPAPTTYGLVKEGVSDMKRAGTPAWVIALIIAATVVAILILRRHGIA